MSLRDEIALLDVRSQEVLEGFETGETPSVWEWAVKSFANVLDAAKAKDAKKLADALNDHDKALQAGFNRKVVWDDYTKVVNDKSRILQSEWSRLRDMKLLVTNEQVMTLIQSLVSVIHKNIEDQATLDNISKGLAVVLDVKSTEYEGPGSQGAEIVPALTGPDDG
jgi:hypothetical protein